MQWSSFLLIVDHISFISQIYSNQSCYSSRKKVGNISLIFCSSWKNGKEIQSSNCNSFFLAIAFISYSVGNPGGSGGGSSIGGGMYCGRFIGRRGGRMNPNGGCCWNPRMLKAVVPGGVNVTPGGVKPWSPWGWSFPLEGDGWGGWSCPPRGGGGGVLDVV